MAETANSQVRAKVWLKPHQVDELRTACYDVGAEYLQQRNEAIVTTLADTGLRVGELVTLDVDHLREGNAKLYLPTHVQKDYPTDNSPPPETLKFASDTKRLLSSYLNGRWKDSPALFPSRSANRITEQGVRDMLHKVAENADVRPFKVDGSRGDASDVTPHALRHSVAYRMLNTEEGNTIYDVRNRLRHRSIKTTERIYDHLDEI
jgi:integrase/recombinase XerD